MVTRSIYVEAQSAVQKQQVLEARQLPYQEVSERICSRLSPRRYNLLISYDLYGELLQDSRTMDRRASSRFAGCATLLPSMEEPIGPPEFPTLPW